MSATSTKKAATKAAVSNVTSTVVKKVLNKESFKLQSTTAVVKDWDKLTRDLVCVKIQRFVRKQFTTLSYLHRNEIVESLGLPSKPDSVQDTEVGFFKQGKIFVRKQEDTYLLLVCYNSRYNLGVNKNDYLTWILPDSFVLDIINS